MQMRLSATISDKIWGVKTEESPSSKSVLVHPKGCNPTGLGEPGGGMEVGIVVGSDTAQSKLSSSSPSELVGLGTIDGSA